VPERPTLTTARLVLRLFEPGDAPEVARLCSAREIALNTLLIPHPYPDGAAERWIASQQETFDRGEGLVFAVTLDGAVTGVVGLRLHKENDSAEIGYWIGVPFWNQGIASEAARAVVGYAFDTLGLHRVFAEHFTRNGASGMVLRRIGMRHEGSARQAHKKWGEYLDCERYAILRDEWQV
jgi:RimJ/RimL family protein N-acetyltransferase